MAMQVVRDGEESEEGRLRRLGNALPVLLAYVDAEQRYQFNNQTYDTWFGVKPASLRGKHIRDVAGDAAYESVRAYIERALAGEMVRFEQWIPYTNGHARAMEVLLAPERDSDGTVVGFHAMAQDITDRDRKARSLQFLVDLDQATQRLTEPEEIMAVTARHLGEHLHVNRCAYAEVGPDEDAFELRDNWTDGTFSIVGSYRMSDFSDETLRLMRVGEPYVVTDAFSDPRCRQHLDAYRATEITAVICVPLIKAGRFVAAMAVHQKTPRRWQQHEIELMQLVAGRCWEAIERARTARGLRESEQRYRSLTVGTTTITWLASPSGEILATNPAWGDFTGQSFEEYRNLGWLDAVHPDDREAIRASWQAAVAEKVSYQAEYRLRRRDGSYRLLAVSSAPVTAADGTLREWIGTCTDIHEQALARRQLDFLSRVAEDTRDLSDPAAIMRTISRLLGRHLGVSRCAYATVEADGESFTIEHDYTNDCDSTAGHYALSLFGPRALEDMRSGRTLIIRDVDRELTPETGGDMFNAIGIKAIVCCPLVKNGTLAAMMAIHHAMPRNWQADEIALVEATVERSWAYIERARVEHVLRQSADRYRLVMRATNDIIWDWDLRTDAVEWNESIHTLRHTPSEIGSSATWWADRVHPDDRDAVLSGIHEVMDDPQRDHWLHEYRFRRGDDTYADVLDRGYVIRDPTGTAVRMLGAMQDLTERKRLERQREQILEEERAARAEAERVGRMKDEFLATLSHELRTPLNAILGWAQLLHHGDLDAPAVEEAVETIERSARAQAQLIEDLLDMSRIISGKVHLEVQQVELAEVINDALKSVLPTANAKQVRIETALSSVGSPILADAGRLQQVFWNLLSNAVKFTPSGGKVRIALEREGSSLRVSVSDTGIGISPDFLPSVFDRFRQADSSPTRRHGGLGLGLSIVKQLVELHGGTVLAASDGAGRGSTFTVRLPVAAVASAETTNLNAPRSTEAESMPAPDLLAGVDVLCVDDEPDARSLLKRILEMAGAGVRVAASGAEALSLLAADQPDVLLCDIGMPDMDGYDLIRRVRSRSRSMGGSVPAAALTAFAHSEDRRRALHAGYQTHVAKPVEPAELLAVIARLVGRTAEA